MLPDLRWNIDYNISALVLLLIVVSGFFARKNLPLRLNRIYRNLLLLSLGSVLFDTMTVFLISWHQLFPQSLITAVNLIYLLCVNAIPPVLMQFLLCFCSMFMRLPVFPVIDTEFAMPGGFCRLSFRLFRF